MTPSPQILFQRWVLAPVDALRKIPNGDGAFAVLSLAFGLYERFIDSSLHAEDKKASPENFRSRVAEDMGLGVGGAEVAGRFWDGYRLGMQHAFQPKAYTEAKGDRWGWDLSGTEGYHFYPEVVNKGDGLYIITLDPWKFVDHVIKRWQENPQLMNELSEFQLGAIAPVQEKSPSRSKPSTPTQDFQLQPIAYRTYQDPPTGPCSTGSAPGAR